ncbi:alpha-1,2-fucosyltransferase [Candidatus Pacearchaeota archaeon]|nr:alpha-1,2-fucosyltransferase [Candidatus Pacearchaeota archaeon]
MLGNALFQIATTIGYAKKYNVPFCFPKWEYQSLTNIPEDCFVDKSSIRVSTYFKEPRYVYSNIPFQDSCSLSGYFQSWKYFENCQDYIRKMLSPIPEEDLKEYCCIHVRRGDYLRYPEHHPIQTMQYYMSAVEKIPVKKFMVFSDDVAWCKQNFTGNEFTVNETSSVTSDFRRMVNCSHFIIANSSFSWWPAWLSSRVGKVVVAPSNWFGSKLKKSNPITDLIPPGWIVI